MVTKIYCDECSKEKDIKKITICEKDYEYRNSKWNSITEPKDLCDKCIEKLLKKSKFKEVRY